MNFLKKIRLPLIVLALLAAALVFLSQGHVYQPEELSYGVTFSKKHSQWLVGDRWRENYLSALDELKIKRLRLPVYWDEVQKNDQDHFDYSDMDWMIEEAGRRDVEVILAIGYRLPRWPECHLPSWSKSLDQEKFQEKTIAYLENTVKRYQSKTQVKAWQIENEPFLRLFGECPSFDSKFLDKEISTVRRLDERPIVITDSGELSLWIPTAKRADIFGTSLYLNTYSLMTKSYIHYPIGPWFFQLKKNFGSFFAKPKKWVIIEMQAEPWGPISYTEMSEQDKARTMDVEKLKDILEFGRQAGFKDFYLWGVEWWYWEKEVKGNRAYWDMAKEVFSKSQ